MDNPNSSYWKDMADRELDKVAVLLGEDDYAVWVELTWPGDLLELRTYKEIFETARNSHSEEEMVCSCNGVTALRNVCQAQARVSYSKDSTHGE